MMEGDFVEIRKPLNLGCPTGKFGFRGEIFGSFSHFFSSRSARKFMWRMRPLTVLYIAMEPRNGARLTDCILQAEELAASFGFEVRFEFNDVPYAITPKSALFSSASASSLGGENFPP